MCSAVEVGDQIIGFAGDAARLPVLLRSGGTLWLPWGEPYGRERGAWVPGPCARLDSIHSGKWDRFRPVAVKIAVERYMERNARNAPYWARLRAGEYLQGLVATVGDEKRVYVVTVETPAPYRHVSERWPRILSTGDASPS